MGTEPFTLASADDPLLSARVFIRPVCVGLLEYHWGKMGSLSLKATFKLCFEVVINGFSNNSFDNCGNIVACV